AAKTNLPSGHSASVLPRASTHGSSKGQVAKTTVAGGGLSSWRPRILILSALDGGEGRTGAGNAMAYVPLMNCIFAAQKRVELVLPSLQACIYAFLWGSPRKLTSFLSNDLPSQSILIDVLKLTQGQDVVFLQQAAHLTAGTYLRLDLDEKGDAVPVSSSSSDSNSSTTGILRLPTLDSVDFRAACFCHRTVVDVGFVCSVCLSIFCEPRKECLICGSTFPRATMRRFADEHKVSAALVEHARLSSASVSAS
ncbi:unnamed protein product, partial [Tilletia caries]